jgi:hypothetical protein
MLTGVRDVEKGSARNLAAVHPNHLAGDERRLVGSDEDNGVGAISSGVLPRFRETAA